MTWGWPDDTLAGIYLALFAFGLVFSVASLLLGAGDDAIDLPGGDGAGDGGLAGDAQDGANGGLGNPSPVNLSTIMVFLTWFGAAGYLARVYAGLPAVASLLAAALAGLVGGALVYLFLARVLWRRQHQLDASRHRLAGTLGRVSSPIRAGGTGEIVYSLDGTQHVDGARSVDGSALPLGAEVVIVRYDRGLAYVRPWTGGMAEGPFLGQPVEPLIPEQP
jgi:membrane protein implicated in regulation of membrane protease activity